MSEKEWRRLKKENNRQADEMFAKKAVLDKAMWSQACKRAQVEFEKQQEIIRELYSMGDPNNCCGSIKDDMAKEQKAIRELDKEERVTS